MSIDSEQDELVVQASEAFSLKQYEKALQIIEPLAAAGNAAAIGMLGLAYKTGSGVEIDGARAVELLQKAVELGDAYAAHSLGRLYMEGMPGVEANNELSNLYYGLAKEMGIAYEAQDQ